MKRQQLHFNELEQLRIPENIDYYQIPGLSTEIREKLTRVRPASIGQAQRISGVTPAAIFALTVYLDKKPVPAKILQTKK